MNKTKFFFKVAHSIKQMKNGGVTIQKRLQLVYLVLRGRDICMFCLRLTASA